MQAGQGSIQQEVSLDWHYLHVYNVLKQAACCKTIHTWRRVGRSGKINKNVNKAKSIKKVPPFKKNKTKKLLKGFFGFFFFLITEETYFSFSLSWIRESKPQSDRVFQTVLCGQRA